jgi:serine protease Do
MRWAKTVTLAGAITLVAVACGDSGGGLLQTTTTSAAATTTAAPPTSLPPATVVPTTSAPATTLPPTTAVTSGAVTSLAEVESAVIQIVAQGTFVDPVEGVQANQPGAGSGFIISEEGIAVTNNHVVTGAALLEIYIPGEARPRNATVIGVSECSDLAVLDISGEGYAYLDWYAEEITTGLPIYAAGYPLGDPQYTLLEGIVSKDFVEGETVWASVDAVIEHSADTLPGNSGGPIVTADGAVVAVNYAGNNALQSFAISRDVASDIIDDLIAGTEAETIGINGEAFVAEGASGIWVYSVESGSPADEVGIEPGDIVTRLENIDLATDGTMSTYCDILRTHRPEDVLVVEVYRPATDELLRGRLNTDERLEAVFSIVDELEGEPIDAEPPSNGGDTYAEYVEVTDDSGTLVMRIPTEWAAIDGAAWEIDGAEVGKKILATTDFDAFFAGWDTPGVFFGAESTVPGTLDETLDQEIFDACTYGDRFDYDDGLFVGSFDIWTDCGGDGGSSVVVIAAQPPDGSFIVLVDIFVVEDRDWDAADEIVASFNVLGPP